jgi:hypothetical protein
MINCGQPATGLAGMVLAPGLVCRRQGGLAWWGLGVSFLAAGPPGCRALGSWRGHSWVVASMTSRREARTSGVLAQTPMSGSATTIVKFPARDALAEPTRDQSDHRTKAEAAADIPGTRVTRGGLRPQEEVRC